MITYFLDHIVMPHFHIFLDHHIRAHEEHQADNQPKADLSDNLKLTVHTFFVLPEHFDIVVGKSQRPQPERGH